MDLLASLGVNSSIFIQFGIFLVVFLVLRQVLFKPYFAAYQERSERTVGKAELAERYVTETRELQEQYAREAQQANEKYKAIYDKTRQESLKEYDRLVGDARARSKQVIDEARKRINGEIEAAHAQLAKEVAPVAQLINQKLIGKDFNT